MKLENDSRAFNTLPQFSGSVSQLRLKTKLKLKKLRKDTAYEVDLNFGYCPSSNEQFDKLMDEMDFWSNIACKYFKDLWVEHVDDL